MYCFHCYIKKKIKLTFVSGQSFFIQRFNFYLMSDFKNKKVKGKLAQYQNYVLAKEKGVSLQFAKTDRKEDVMLVFIITLAPNQTCYFCSPNIFS